MPNATDAMVARLQAEIEERTSFQDQLIERAQADGRDLNAQEMELYNGAAERIGVCNAQLGPLQDGLRIAQESATRSAELARQYTAARAERPAPIEYRTAGEYIVDQWQAGAGDEAARQRLTIYQRAAAHQTTADNLGVIPDPVVGGVIQFIDSARPLVSALGPQSAPAGMFKRPRITQHTDVGAQTAEKTELISRKMLIDSLPVSMTTFGGYVNVSRQNIDWSSPNILDIVVNDLAAQYAIETEQATCGSVTGDAGGAVTPPIAATSTPEDIAKAVWTAAGQAYAAMKGTGRLVLAVAPDVLGWFGPLFAPVNPTNAQGSGFSAASFGSGVMGQIGGIPVVMSPGLTAGTAHLINTAAEEVYEQRVGTLQVTEPSVLGVQVAYAGYFASLTINGAGIVKLTA